MDISASAVPGHCLAQHSKSTAKRAQGNGNEMAGGAAAGVSALLQMMQPVRREDLGLLVNQPPNGCCTQLGALKDTSFGLTAIPGTAGTGQSPGEKGEGPCRAGPLTAPSQPCPWHCWHRAEEQEAWGRSWALPFPTGSGYRQILMHSITDRRRQEVQTVINPASHHPG